VLLEVRESNQAARRLYEREGFIEVGRRAGYYHRPPEAALLFRFSVADV
jgi:ribosomal-protein-alanine N-acetyltransferase